MNVNGTLINYYFHCKRQCWLHGNRLNLEDNSEVVKIGKAIHEEKAEQSRETELAIENIKLDKLTKDYLVEVKKSDADVEAATWQVLLYLKILKDKGIEINGKLEFIEKNKNNSKTLIIEMDEEAEKKLDDVIIKIKELIKEEKVPNISNKSGCKKCAYYEYCYI